MEEEKDTNYSLSEEDSELQPYDFSISSVDKFLKDHGFDVDEDLSSVSQAPSDKENEEEGDEHNDVEEDVEKNMIGEDIQQHQEEDNEEEVTEDTIEEEEEIGSSVPISEEMEKHIESSAPSSSSGQGLFSSRNMENVEPDESMDRSMLLGLSADGGSAKNNEGIKSSHKSSDKKDASVSSSSTFSRLMTAADAVINETKDNFSSMSIDAEEAASRGRVDDEELTRALGVKTGARSSASERSNDASNVDIQRKLFHEDEESKEDGYQSTKSSFVSTTTDRWSELNKILRKNGLQSVKFQEVSLLDSATIGRIPEANSILDVVRDLVTQLDRKEQIIQDLVLDSNLSSRVQSRTEGSLLSSEKKNKDVQKSLVKAENEIKRLKEEMRKEKDAYEAKLKKLEMVTLRLRQQLKVSEHRVKAKETLVERMQQKLQQQVDKENISKAKEQNILEKLSQSKLSNRSGASRHPLPVSGSSSRAKRNDPKTLEWVGMFETQKERMQEEIATLRTQVRELNAELRDKENYISRKEYGSVGSASWYDDEGDDVDGKSSRHNHSYASDELLHRLEAARREQEQTANRLRHREASMIKKVHNIEQELVIARETIAELKEENSNLLLEAESRPSIRDYRLSQRRIHQLERQLSESKLALEEATDLQELRKYMGTKELIHRDRLNHRLRLNRLDALPRSTALEIVKEVCRVLNLTDVTLVIPSLEKLCTVVNAVPRMEKFIRDVCGFVYLHCQREEDNQIGSPEKAKSFALEDVLPTLQKWRSDLQRLHSLEGFKVAVVMALCKRSVEPGMIGNILSPEEATFGKDANLSRVIASISELVELEKNVVHQKEIYNQATAELKREPNVLINRIISHFSNLFKIKSVEGLLPKINELYLFVNEMQNFLKVARITLNLDDDTSPANCLNALRDRIENDNVIEEPLKAKADRVELEGNYVVEKRRDIMSAPGEIAGVKQVRDMSILIRDLKRELGAATMQDILPRTKRLMELLSLSIQPEEED